jgi:hypothetical protein
LSLRFFSKEEDEGEEQRLLLSGTLASDGDFSETEFGSPHVRNHRSLDEQSEFAPAVLPAGHRKSVKSFPKMRRYSLINY